MPEKAIGPEFMRLTKYDYAGPTAQEKGEPQPPLEIPYNPQSRLVDLPDPLTAGAQTLDLPAILQQRRSHRKYAAQPISLAELSFLLWATQGVKKVTSRPVTLRTVPSAGARHAFETLLLINKVDGVEPALYRYAAIEHALLRLEAPADINQQITHACLDQNQVLTSAVTFIWVAVVDRMRYRYGQRGYRYLHLDAGHVCQNLYLAAEVIGCGVCAIAAFNDDELNRVLSLDGDEQFAIYLGSLGRQPD